MINEWIYINDTLNFTTICLRCHRDRFTDSEIGILNNSETHFETFRSHWLKNKRLSMLNPQLCTQCSDPEKDIFYCLYIFYYNKTMSTLENINDEFGRQYRNKYIRLKQEDNMANQSLIKNHLHEQL